MTQLAARPGDELHAAEGGARDLVLGGGAAGVIGGVLMAAILPIGAILGDQDPLEQLRALGLTFLGEGSSLPTAALVGWGLFVHLVVSAVLGILFTSILPAGFPYGSAAVVGLGYAWIAMAISISLVVPRLNPALASHMPELGGTWVIAHSLYGLGVGAGPLLRARLRHR